MKADFLKLNTLDFWKGLLVAVLTAAVTSLYAVITAAVDFKSFNWQLVVLSAAGAFVSYIIKNLFTNSDGQVMKPER